MTRRKAVTALASADGWILGLAEENVGGYCRLNYGPFENNKEAEDLAARMNEVFGISKKMATLIVLSSMRPLSDVAHAKRTATWPAD